MQDKHTKPLKNSLRSVEPRQSAHVKDQGGDQCEQHKHCKRNPTAPNSDAMNKMDRSKAQAFQPYDNGKNSGN